MADKAAPAKTTTSRAAALKEQMSALGSQDTAAATPARERPARQRKTPAAGARRAAAPMPAEQPKPPAAYSARISHTTTAGQLQALETVRSQQKATGGGAVSVTALLRAATALCLDDERLRARWIKLARNEWR
jgi:hypothetical protein